MTRLDRRRLWKWWGVAALGAESLSFYLLLNLVAAAFKPGVAL